jgi:outer membrane receptor protein involved in Fe transport
MVFLFAAALAAAATPTPSPSPSPSTLPSIAHVVTSDRGSELATHAARTTYVVTAADIARNGNRTIADAIENLPSVEIQRYGAFGAQANVGIRGSSNAQVLVLLDGLPMAGAQIENVNLEQYGVAGIDRIEVVEGGGSTLYGSGSIGGVINIITNGHAPTSATVATGSFDEQTYQLTTPFFSFQRTYAGNAFPLPDGTTRTNADAGLTTGTLTFAHRAGAFDVEFLGSLSDATLGDPGQLPLYTSPTSRQQTISRDLRLRAEKHSKQATFSVAVGASGQALTYTCNTPADSSCFNFYATPAPSGTAPPYNELLADNHAMVSVSNAVGDERHRLVYGVDLSRGNARIDGGTGWDTTAYNSIVTTDAYAQTAAYVQSQWFGTRGGGFYVGLRCERDLNSLSTAQGSALSPSIGGIVTIGSSLQLKLNAATAFRAPTADELFYPPQGVFSNNGLVPERTRVADATLVDTGRFGQASIGWFTNVGHAVINGLTLALETAPYRRVVTSFSLTDLYQAQDLDTNTRLPGRGPVLSMTTGLRYAASAESRFDGFGVKLTSNGLSEQPQYIVPFSTTPNPPYAQAAASTLLDAYAGYRITPKLVLTLRGYNLLDDRYATYNGYPMPGRSIALELRSR